MSDSLIKETVTISEQDKADWHSGLDEIFDLMSKPCKCSKITTINSVMYYTCNSCGAKLSFSMLKPIMDSIVTAMRKCSEALKFENEILGRPWEDDITEE